MFKMYEVARIKVKDAGCKVQAPVIAMFAEADRYLRKRRK